MKLSPQQYHAANTRFESVAVVAGAGSGKTAVIVARYRSLIEELSVLPDQVVIVTFTVKAAAELKRRITAANLPEPGYVGTVHGWCVRHLPIGYAVASERVAKTAQEWACEIMPGEAFPDPKEIAEPSICETSRAYKAYTSYLLRNGLYDFDMLLKVALAKCVVTPPEDHLIVDEFQDTGPVERLIYQTFTGWKFFVGDPRQTIYGFRGAAEWNPDSMDSFTLFGLTTTYRCPAVVCSMVNKLIPSPYPLSPAKQGGQATYGDGPVKWISDNLLLDAAILCRSNREVAELEAMLKGNGLPVLEAAPVSEVVEKYTDWLSVKLAPDNDAIVDAFLRKWEPADHERATAIAHRTMSGIAACITIGVTFADRLDPVVDEMIALYPDDQERLAALYNLRRSFPDGPGFRVMTIHQAKGLEWPNVCVYIPKWFNKSAENERLLYVAMTRASERLHLSASHLRVVPEWVRL